MPLMGAGPGLAMRSGAERPRRVVLVGAGRVGRAIAARLPLGWSLVVVDVDPAVEAPLREVRPDCTFVAGDGSSRLTLERCGLDGRSVLIAATSSDAVNLEAARVAAAHFGVEERVVVAGDPGDVVPIGECVHPAEAVAGSVVNRVSIEASRAVDIGLGVGEILQVSVLEGSAAAGRALKDFGARHWLVAAVYRAGALIVPHGDTRIAAGDRVLLVGDPTILEDVAPYFRGGAPVFPSQFGAGIARVAVPATSAYATWLATAAGVETVIETPRGFADLAGVSPEEWVAWLDKYTIACSVHVGTTLPWYVRLGLVRSRLHTTLVAGRRPFLLVRGQPRAPRRLLVCVHDPQRQREVLLAGIDLARLADAAIEVLTVDAPGATADPSWTADIQRLSRLYDVDIEHRRVAGNPVAQIREAARRADLVVLGVRPEHNSPFAPDVSVHLLHDLPVSAVFVPWSPAG